MPPSSLDFLADKVGRFAKKPHSLRQSLRSLEQNLRSLEQNLRSLRQSLRSLEQNLRSLRQNLRSLRQNLRSLRQNLRSGIRFERSFVQDKQQARHIIDAEFTEIKAKQLPQWQDSLKRFCKCYL
ncbi:hypothetical protein [Phormidesmis sp. 146-33]